MRVLVLSPVNRDNPFTIQFYHSIRSREKVDLVQHGTHWLYSDPPDFDIVHIHWPEALTHWQTPRPVDQDRIQTVLKQWSEEGSIVATVHNKYPHGQDTSQFRSLYNTVYSFADGIVHLGESTKDIVRNRYQREVSDTEEVVIPHGNYEWFPSDVSRSKARSALGIQPGTCACLSFGAVRGEDEFQLLKRGFDRSNIDEKKLILAGRLPFRPKTSLKHFVVRVPLWLRNDTRLTESFIPYDEVQRYLTAADILIIPRIGSINSGNVYLGLTFGCVVVGPDIAVIGETLRNTDNPVYTEGNPDALAGALEQASQLLDTGLGEKNKDYAQSELAWQRIGEMHIDLYNDILSS